MSILGIYFNNIGEAGQFPQFGYIDTNNTVAQVLAVGFLNEVVSQGISLTDKSMALVNTKASPSAKSTQTALFNISFSNGNWSLIPTSTPLSLPNNQIFIGSSSNVAVPRTMNGDATMTNTGTITLVPTIRPTAIVKLFGHLATTGGVTEVFSVPGLDEFSDVAFAQMAAPNANGAIIRTIDDSVDDQLTITFSVDPGVGAEINYQVIRSVF